MIQIKDILRYMDSENIKYDVNDNFLMSSSIETYAPLKHPIENSIMWARNIDLISPEQLQNLNQLSNIVVVCKRPNVNCLKFSHIIVENPHKVYFKIVAHFFDTRIIPASVSTSAVVKTAQVGENVTIGDFTFIDSRVKIGNNVSIGCNVTIEGTVTIGDNTRIESGTVIGFCGFGYYKEEDGTSSKIPHLGGVTIGRNCDIGANCTIARGTLSDTIIGDYVKLDAMCHVAHNVEIGDRVIMAGGTKIAGSTIIMNDVWIGGDVAISNGLTVGENCFIGIGSVVTKNIPAGKAAFGSPARIIRDNSPNIYNS